MSSTEADIDRILERYRVPPEDAQAILDDVMLTMLVKRDRIRDPERWLRKTLRNRCLQYWRKRRRILYRVADRGILGILASEEVEESEKVELRRELEAAAEGMPEDCRELLRRRYGLGGSRVRIDPRPWDPREELREELYRCVAGLLRRVAPGLAPEEE